MEYEHSAQVVDIMGRGAYSLIINHQGLHSYNLNPSLNHRLAAKLISVNIDLTKNTHFCNY